MSIHTQQHRTIYQPLLPARPSRENRPGRRWLWLAVLLVLGGLVVVLHGCHGEDEDTELFRRLSQATTDGYLERMAQNGERAFS
jgi:hypothetical protein